MKTLVTLLISFVSINSLAASTQWQLAWKTERVWKNTKAAQQWVAQTSWQPALAAQLQGDANGLGYELNAVEESITVDSLFYDFSTEKLDWTIGRKPQEWSYSFSDDNLNWINQEMLIAADAYLTHGLWQNYCLQANSTSACGSRFSGWFGQSEFQLMAEFGDAWKTAVAAQTPLGQSGLLFVETYWQQKAQKPNLTEIAPNTYFFANTEESHFQANTGVSWTLPIGTDIRWEMSVSNQSLSAKQWQQVVEQLDDENSGLVAEAFNSRLGQQQHLIHIQNSWKKISAENTFVYWPQAQHSWLNTFSTQYSIDSKLTFSLEWSFTPERSVLGEIGQRHQLAVRFTFKDGL